MERQQGCLLDLVCVYINCRQPLALCFELEYGVEKHVELDGLSESEVVSKVEQLLNP